MNPELIYSEYRDDALAHQVGAAKYSSFAAMPFRDQDGYNSAAIFKDVVCGASKLANELVKGRAAELRKLRLFDDPKRVDQRPGLATEITEDIVIDILKSHFFIADLTFANPGVLIETGVALGLKPTKQIILLLQGSPSHLHFDIKDNRVINYNDPDGLKKIAEALIATAEEFEKQHELRVKSVTRRLNPSAIKVLWDYGSSNINTSAGTPVALDQTIIDNALHAVSGLKASDPHEWLRRTIDITARFDGACQELVERRLFEMDYKPNLVLSTVYQAGQIATDLGDTWGLHPTPLGLAVIDSLWPFLRRSKATTSRPGFGVRIVRTPPSPPPSSIP